MPKDKNYKRIAKNAAKDKVNNIIFIMKFLNSKGGLELIKEYFAEAVPSYVIQFVGLGGAKKWVMRQWLKASPHGYMQKISKTIAEEGQLINPIENYEILEDTEKQIVTKLKCNYKKRLIKAAKQFQCDFDVQDYYCNHACIPILTKISADIYLKMQVALTDNGCMQTIQVDKSSFSKAEAENEEKKEK